MNVLLRYTLAFVWGILLHTALPAHRFMFIIDQWLLGWVGFSVSTLLLLLLFRRGGRYGLGTLMLLLFFSLGWLRAPSTDTVPDMPQVTAYEAVVLAPPETRAKSFKTEVEVRRGKWNGAWHPMQEKVLLYIDKNAVKPRYGDVLLIRGQPRPVDPPMNPAQFDYRTFLSRKQIYHQHYLKPTEFVLTGQSQGVWYKQWAYSVSEWSDAALRRLVVLDREYAVAKAMVLGLRDEMDSELVQSYAAAGAVHVLSVSGFHIAIFISLLTLLLKKANKSRYGRGFSLVIILLTMWFYAVLTGLSAPVIRSALMFTIFLLAEPFQRKKNKANALFGSALILLALDPLLLYSVSFQLSYAALGGILFIQPTLYQIITGKNWLLDKAWELTTVAIAAQLVTFPIAVYYFYQFPSYFLFANPFVTLLSTAMLPVAIVALTFSWVPFFADVLGWLLTMITWALNKVVVWTDALPFSKLEGLSLSVGEVGLIYGIMALLLGLVYYREIRWGWGALLLSGMLCTLQLRETQHFQHQKLVVVHAVSHQTALSFIQGNNALLLADSAFLKPNGSPFNFFLKNFYAERAIRYVHHNPIGRAMPPIKQLPFGKLIVWQGNRFLLVEQPIRQAMPPVADYIVIRNSAFRTAAHLLTVFGTQKLIFDHSNKHYLLETLQQEAETLGLPWYFIPKKGAFLAFL
ncbi:ComEC/Rec2-related protein [Runella slithyformis DSM 19594]|uniref:ComEC/Rec2-related protein n=2 Tax=Runella TaxID=105 RepID=A0A7U3ZQX3_RUNSL|nr:ComEC/Rec2-related protein [Runella slithyformis DSM 19594]